MHERVRDALYDGYEENQRFVRDEGFEERRRLHLLLFVTANMNWASDWITPETADEVERDYRELFAELL
ncbi:hypothetical protein [Halosimplex salinum]|uniref:hypothetical protein n=1 Tax=Halosimplex salinum TaxID=1710538 RepID=UPI000F47F8D4|nr:hypothetical protein [Halosimplex salinum]